MWFIIGCFIIVFMGAATAAYMVKMKEEFEKFKNKYTTTPPDVDPISDFKDKDIVKKKEPFVPDEPVVAEIKETELYSYVDSSEKSIYFGNYPQTEIKDETLIMELNKKAGTLPNKENTYNWIDYDYYVRGKIKSYMYYIDIKLDGNKYRGVYFTRYRPYDTTTDSNTYQDNNGYSIKTTYWFKYEKVKWNILKTENGKALIVSDLILDSQDYYYSESLRSDATDYQGNTTTSTVYANNYMYSHIREWLNETFYDATFNASEKGIIETTTVDNSAATTSSGSNIYACSNTNDKMFLLSYQDYTTYSVLSGTTALQGTDYAKSQGLYVSSGNSYNWLRSPFNVVNYRAMRVGNNGNIGNSSVYDTSTGVRAACWINL